MKGFEALLLREELAQLLRICERSTYNLEKLGLPSVTVLSVTRFDWPVVLAWLSDPQNQRKGLARKRREARACEADNAAPPPPARPGRPRKIKNPQNAQVAAPQTPIRHARDPP